MLFLGLYGKGVYQSMDGGDTWFPMDMGDVPASVYTVFVDRRGERLYVGTGGQPSLYTRSLSGGSSWEAVDLSGRLQKTVYDIEINPTNPDEIYAAAFPGTLFRTTNGGETWTEMTSALKLRRNFITGIGYEDFYYTLAINPIDPRELFLGVYLGQLFRSRDGGETWSDYSQGLVRRGIVTDVETDGHLVYVAQKAGGVLVRRIEEVAHGEQ
jgi:photosystem II stability/assembly factor-like uncharacterized protein